MIIVSARAARDAEIHFYRASNGVILSDGIDGVIPPRFIRSVRLLPTFELLWANEDRVWKIPELVENGDPFEAEDTDNEEVTARVDNADQSSDDDECGSKGTSESGDIATRTNMDEELSLDSSEHSGFSDEFFTQTVFNDQTMDHFDTDDEFDDTHVSPSQSAVTPTPAPNVEHDQVSPRRNDRRKEGQRGRKKSGRGRVYERNASSASSAPKRSRAERVIEERIETTWQLGQPYYRNDGPNNGGRAESNGNGGAEIIIVDSSTNNRTVVQNGDAVQTQMCAFVNTQHAEANATEGHVQSVTNSQWPMTLEQSALAFPSWCQSYVSPRNSASSSPMQGTMTPMADVASSSWAQYPSQTLHGQFGLQAQRRQYGRSHPKSSPVSPEVRSRDVSAASSGHVTPKKRRNRNRKDVSEENRRVHGARVLAAAGAHILWKLLDEPNPQGPDDPEEGVSQEVIDAARRGRTAAKLAIEVSTTRAQEYWRSQSRSKQAHGRPIEELYEEYDQAAAAYKRRRRATTMQ